MQRAIHFDRIEHGKRFSGKLGVFPQKKYAEEKSIEIEMKP